MALWWKSMRGFVNESHSWQKQATGSYCISDILNHVLQGFCFQSTSNSSGEKTSFGILIKFFLKNPVSRMIICISTGQWLVQIGFPLLCHHQGYTMKLLSEAYTGGWAELSGSLGEWNKRWWSWWQQEPLCSCFTALPRQTSVTLLRCSFCSQAKTWEGSRVWCSVLAAGWVNNMLM